jgi:hypothetical protein
MSVYLLISENGKLEEINGSEIDSIFRKIREGKTVTVEAIGQIDDEPLGGMRNGKKTEISFN